MRENLEMHIIVHTPKGNEFVLPGFDVRKIDTNEINHDSFYATPSHSSYSELLFHAGNYEMISFNVGDQEIQFMFFSGKRKIYEKFGVVDKIKDILAFYTDTYGPLYMKDFFATTEIKRPLIILERNNAGAYATARENVCLINGSTLISTIFGEDEIELQSIQQLAECFAGQWWSSFGHGVNVYPEEIWSESALIKYSAYLYVKDRYGAEVGNDLYPEMWKRESKRLNNSFYWRNKEYIEYLSLSQIAIIYQANWQMQEVNKMPLMLFAMQEELGENVFLDRLQLVYETYKSEEQMFFAEFIKTMGFDEKEYQAYVYE